jgi:excisionase family DNA binding protein
MQTDERLTLTIKEAAAMLGISRNLAYELARRGELPGVIKLGEKRIVVSRAQLENLLRGRANANG